MLLEYNLALSVAGKHSIGCKHNMACFNVWMAVYSTLQRFSNYNVMAIYQLH